MSDIDFLGHKKENDKAKPEEKKSEAAWSRPEQQALGHKASAFSFLPFLNRKKPEPAKRPAVAAAGIKLKQSRKEILRLIKNSEASAMPAKSKAGRSLLSGLKKKFARQPEQREVMIDYQKIFNQEKAKKNSPAPLTGQTGNNQAVPVPAIKAAGWLTGLKKMFRTSGQPPNEIKPEKKPETAPVTLVAPEAAAEAASDVVETNLIEGEIVTFFDWRQKITIFIGAVLASIFLAALAHLALTYYQNQSQEKNQEQARKFAELKAELDQERAGLKEISDFQARLKLVSQIFSQHIYWSNFFKFLEDNTLKQVYYSGFDGDTGGHYTLAASAEKYGNIAEQAKILINNENITEIKALGGELVSGDEENNARIKFVLEFSILKKIFTQ